MQQVDLVVRNALIVTQDEKRTVIDGGALAVQDGVILAGAPSPRSRLNIPGGPRCT
jgi:hypothetical protein